MKADEVTVDHDFYCGPLQSIISTPGVTDVAVLPDGSVWADSGNGMHQVTPDFPLVDSQLVRELAISLCAQVGVRLDDAHPIADASSDTGIRIHAVIAPLVLTGASISIRLPQLTTVSFDALCGMRFMPQVWADLLRCLIKKKACIAITGGTGSGKTTLLRALMNECDPSDRIVVVEEIREIGGLGRPNTVSLMSRESNIEGSGSVTLTDLVSATLRMRPDRIIVGECRGKEVADIMRAFTSGHRGGIVTIHANNATSLPRRLISLGQLGGFTAESMAALVPDTFDVVLHVERTERGRHISQIGQICDDGRCEIVAQWDGGSGLKTGPHWQEFSYHWGMREGAQNGIHEISSLALQGIAS